MKKIEIKKIVTAAIFTAVIAATAWISIPTPFGINLTFTLFGVCLTGFVLGAKYGFVSTAVYIALGAMGLPVFSLFLGGFGVLLGVSGGFLWGFLFTAILCGTSTKLNKKLFKCLLMIFSVLICHIAGVIQFCVVSGNNLYTSFLTASLPFLAKDVILVFVAYGVAQKIRR